MVRRCLQVTLFQQDLANPDVQVTKKQTHLTVEEIADIIKQFKVNNANVVVREDITPEDLVDHLAGNRVYIPAVALVNKVDLVGEEKYKEVEAV